MSEREGGSKDGAEVTEVASDEAPGEDSSSVSVRHQSVQWSGALPPPDALRRFDELIPDGAERIMRLTERQTDHRIAYESKALDANIGESRRGQWLGASISLAALAGCVLSIYLGAHPLVSAGFLGVPVFSIVQAIISSRSGQN